MPPIQKFEPWSFLTKSTKVRMGCNDKKVGTFPLTPWHSPKLPRDRAQCTFYTSKQRQHMRFRHLPYTSERRRNMRFRHPPYTSERRRNQRFRHPPFAARGGKMAERSGFEPEDPVAQVNCLAGSCYQPLSHLSKLFTLSKILTIQPSATNTSADAR